MDFLKFLLTWAGSHPFLAAFFAVMFPAMFAVVIILPLAILHDMIVGVAHMITTIFRKP